MSPLAPPGRDRLLQNYREINDQQCRELMKLRAAANKMATEEGFWFESWESLVLDIADLMNGVRDRPKGRRFVTVLDLDNLLKRAARDKREVLEPTDP